MILWPSEKILWIGKPDKRAYLFPILGGFALGLLLIGFAVLFYLMKAPDSEFLLILGGGSGIGIILVPSLYLLKKHDNLEYILTNQRFIIKSGFSKRFDFLSILDKWFPGKEMWFAEYDEIKDFKIKKEGFSDKIFGTAHIYPITSEFPYLPEMYPNPYQYQYPTCPSDAVFDVYNAVTGKNEKVTHVILWEKTHGRPRLETMKRPYEIAEFLRKNIIKK